MNPEGENLPEPAQPPAEPENKFEPQPRSTADYNKYSAAPKSSKLPSQWKRWTAWLGIVIAIFVVLLIGYKFLQKKPPSTTTQTPANSQSQSNQSQPTITTATKNYASQNFALSFDYPQDWTVADNGNGIMTVKSPSMILTDSSGQAQKTFIVLTFRNKTQKLTEFDAGNATAERDSSKIAYAKPTQTQRADTYLSFLRYAKSTAGIDGIYITGNSGYKSVQVIPGTDISKVDPVINYAFIRDTTGTKVAEGPVTIASSVWDNSTFSTSLLNILKSLVIT